MGILAMPFGWLMKGCYLLVKNYGIALLIFTIITRLITLPLNIKQQRSTARMSQIQPELEKLKQKYGKNQEKLNEETMRLYSENNINPMASCLPALIPIILLYAMIPVVYKPMTYITNADKNNIEADSELIRNLYSISTVIDRDGETVDQILAGLTGDERVGKLEEKVNAILESEDDTYKNDKKVLSAIGSDDMKTALTVLSENEGLDTFISDKNIFTANIMQNRYGTEVLFFNFHNKADGKYLGILHNDVQQEIKKFNYTAFGLDLGKIPATTDATVMIPIASAVLQLITTIISQIFQKKNNPEMKMQGSMLMMLLMFPLLSLWIGFKFPCALGIYWIYSSLFAVAQVFFLNIVYTPEKIKEMAAKDNEKARQRKKAKGPSMLEKALEIKNEQNGGSSSVKLEKKNNDDNDDSDDDGDKKLTKSQQKEANRQKLNEARKRYAEKYGDEYHED
ncbi:MAG: YidC/Oxa1 family membrane protein insertase [Ruminococcus sp.]|nr:YidC/Oxa1 family membrane protein insertase [Ruminococcus sp.]